MPTTARPATLAELRTTGWRSRTVKDELRANLLARLADGRRGPAGRSSATRTPSCPAIENAILAGQDIVFLGERGQAKTRMARLLVGLLDEWLPDRRRRRAQRRPVRADQRRRPRPSSSATATTRADRLAAARPPLRREARHAGHHDRRPHRRGRPDQGRRGPLPVRRADAPLRPHPARQPRHLRHQRAARPRRAHPGRPAQHPRGARRPDPRLHGPPAARPVRRRQRQPGGLHQPRPDHHAAQGPPRVADPDALPADARPRDRDHPPGEACASPCRGRRPPVVVPRVHGGARRRAHAPRPPLPGDQPALGRVGPRVASPTWRCSRPRR